MKKDSLKRKPCAKCPYTLGLVKTLTNPCPECKLNGYQSYEWFQKQLSGEGSDVSGFRKGLHCEG